MRPLIVAALGMFEALIACAIFACSLELSRDVVRSHAIGNAATLIVRSTRRLAESGLQVRISIERNA